MIAHAVKHAETEIRGRTSRVHAALELVRGLEAAGSGRALEVAQVLDRLQADDDVLLAGLLLPCLDAGLPAEDPRVGECFGDAPLRLARELQRVGGTGLPAGWNPGQALRPEQAEGLRKLLLALASDVRLVLVRLALQLVRMRDLKQATPTEQQRAALETFEIYAPLASRLGIWQLKWELEDLAFRYSQPDEYKRIAGWLRTKRVERERYIDDVRRELERELGRPVRALAYPVGRPIHDPAILGAVTAAGYRLGFANTGGVNTMWPAALRGALPFAALDLRRICTDRQMSDAMLVAQLAIPQFGY
jgi:hypothetical protein